MIIIWGISSAFCIDPKLQYVCGWRAVRYKFLQQWVRTLLCVGTGWVASSPGSSFTQGAADIEEVKAFPLKWLHLQCYSWEIPVLTREKVLSFSCYSLSSVHLSKRSLELLFFFIWDKIKIWQYLYGQCDRPFVSSKNWETGQIDEPLSSRIRMD